MSENKTSSKAFVIDATNRGLGTTGASVTQAETGLVIREAIELPDLDFLTRERFFSRPLEVEEPVVVVGNEGYQAQSSAGFVEVDNVHGITPTRAIIGRLSLIKGGLRVVSPTGGLVMPSAKIFRDRTHGNSNPHTASTARWAAGFLKLVDPRGVSITEGQSDYTQHYRLMPLQERGEDPTAFRQEVVFADEHQVDRFTLEAIMLARSNAYAKSFVGEYEQDLRATREQALRSFIDFANNGSKPLPIGQWNLVMSEVERLNPAGPSWGAPHAKQRFVDAATYLLDKSKEELEEEEQQRQREAYEAIPEWEKDLMGLTWEMYLEEGYNPGEEQ
jgi:hypothetical protein